jgi:non-specific serine/threonine protein kinase
LKQLALENDNLCTALQWALASRAVTLGLRLASALLNFWFIRGYNRGVREDLMRLLTLPEAAAPSAVRAKALAAAGYMVADESFKARLLEEALAISHAVDDPQTSAMALRTLGALRMQQREYASAETHLSRSLALWQELGNRHYIGLLLALVGEVALYQGEVARARALFEASAEPLREVSDDDQLAYTLRRLGQVATHQGRVADAMALIQESLTFNLIVGDRRGIAACLAALAQVLLSRGDTVSAVRLLGAVSGLLDDSRTRLHPFDDDQYQATLATARRQLDAATFDAAWATGAALTLDQAVAAARQL